MMLIIGRSTFVKIGKGIAVSLQTHSASLRGAFRGLLVAVGAMPPKEIMVRRIVCCLVPETSLRK